MKQQDRVILLADCQSFYASVEKAAHPEYKDRPVAVGDPSRMNGIVLAACPLAKSKGVTTASRVGEALALCPELIVVRPRMGMYIEVSLLITRIFESYTDQVEPYSIDEQFLDVTGSAGYYGSAEETARNMQNHVKLSTGVQIRVGIGPTKILAKMATDNYAKKNVDGIYTLTPEKLESTLWTLPVNKMFMVASRMTKHFTRMGLNTIGDIARLEFPEFKRRMRQRMGKQSDIQAGYYWQTARGIDPSPVVAGIRHQIKSVSHGKALRWRLYRTLADIEVVLLELVVEVCQRTRKYGYMGTVLAVSAMETDGERTAGFSRQVTMDRPTSITHEVAAVARELFQKHWSGLPIGRLSIALSGLTDDSAMQLTLFDDRDRSLRKEKVIDALKERFGSAAIMRASSLLEAGVARERAEQIGGHYK